jgi:chromosome segregation ATPase
VVSYSPFISLFRTIDALTAANARIASLEAKLDASRKAWDVATAAKVAAEKTAKSAETKAKKAEKALVTVDQKRAQRDRTVAERMDKISALLGGERRVVYFLLFFSRAPNC